MPVATGFWKGASLSDWAKALERGKDLAGTYVAHRARDVFKSRTEENTPKDTGELRAGWETGPVVHFKWGWESNVYTEISYAPHVEWGTGLWGPKHAKYIIKPKLPGGVLAFFARLHTPEGKPVLDEANNPVEGEMVFARYVMHPGSPGQHMLATGAAMAETELDRIGAQGFRVMRTYVEKQSKIRSVA